MAYSNIGKGHPIGSFTNENGTVYTLYESVTGLNVTLTGNTLDVKYIGEEEALSGSTVNDTFTIDLSSVVPANAIISATDLDTTTGKITFTKGDGSTFTSTVETLTTLAIGTGTNIIYTDEKGTPNTIDLSSVIKAGETITSLSFDGSNLKYIDEAGVTNTLDITSIAADCCIASVSGIDKSTGVVTITRNDGTTFTISVDALTSISFDGSNLSYIDEKGNTTTLDLTSLIADCCISGATYSQASGQVTFTKNDGSVFSVQTESLTTLTFSGTNLSYTDEKGIINSIDLSGLLAAAISNTLTNDGTNTLTSTVSGKASNASIVNSVAGSTSSANLTISVNGIASTAIDLTSVVKAAETITTSTDTNANTNKHEIAKYVNEANATSTINETVTSFSAIVDNTLGTLTLTHVDENGTSNATVVDICALIAACTPTSTVFNMGYHPTDASIACADAP